MSKKFRLYATICENAGRESKPNDYQSHEEKYNHALFLLRGKEIEVETKYLFLNQLNTPPIKGVTENGLRLMFTHIKSLRIENRTFRTIKMRLMKRYKEDWNQNLQKYHFSVWKDLLGID